MFNARIHLILLLKVYHEIHKLILKTTVDFIKSQQGYKTSIQSLVL